MASAAATALWSAVVTSYNSDDLVSLTNIRDRSATTITTAVGQDAAQGVVDLWPIYAQADFDTANAQHVEVAKRGVIALLWSRGGTAASVAKIEWDEIFGDQGMIAKLRNTGARSRPTPTTNSDLQASRLDSDGTKKRPWSDQDSLPINYLPARRSAVDE
jgi:hypothetical protein